MTIVDGDRAAPWAVLGEKAQHLLPAHRPTAKRIGHHHLGRLKHVPAGRQHRHAYAQLVGLVEIRAVMDLVEADFLGQRHRPQQVNRRGVVAFGTHRLGALVACDDRPFGHDHRFHHTKGTHALAQLGEFLGRDPARVVRRGLQPIDGMAFLKHRRRDRGVGERSQSRNRWLRRADRCGGEGLRAPLRSTESKARRT